MSYRYRRGDIVRLDKQLYWLGEERGNFVNARRVHQTSSQRCEFDDQDRVSVVLDLSKLVHTATFVGRGTLVVKEHLQVRRGR